MSQELINTLPLLRGAQQLPIEPSIAVFVRVLPEKTESFYQTLAPLSS